MLNTVIIVFLAGQLVSAQEEIPELCLAQPEISTCGWNHTLFFFDRATKECVCKKVDRCDREGIGFASLAACLKTCVGQHRCLLPKKRPRTCRGRVTRWYYNSVTGSCGKFNFGTRCKGNANRFTSQEACEESCPPMCQKLELPICANGDKPEMKPTVRRAKQCNLNDVTERCSENYTCEHHKPTNQSICCPVTCPRYEEKNDMGRCEQTCEGFTHNGSQNRPCTEPEKCVCEVGYYRNGNGSCVPGEACLCSAEETYTVCANRSEEARCGPRQSELPSDCQPGCVCSAGYYRQGEPQGHTCVLDCQTTIPSETSQAETTVPAEPADTTVPAATTVIIDTTVVVDTTVPSVTTTKAPCKRGKPDVGRFCGGKRRRRRTYLRFWFEECSRSCLPFRYRGCRGDTNNYRTRDACRKTRTPSKGS